MLRPLCAPDRSRSALALLLVAGLTLTGCAGSDPDAAAEPTVTATTAAPSETTSAEPAPTPTPDDAQSLTINVAGGQVTGVEPRTEVPLGTRVRLSITSDVADEVHVHGFELTGALSPGQALQLEFVAEQPGLFAVELHDAGTVLTRLQVQ